MFESIDSLVAFGASPMDSKSDTRINSSGGGVFNSGTGTLTVSAHYSYPPSGSRKWTSTFISEPGFFGDSLTFFFTYFLNAPTARAKTSVAFLEAL